MQVPLVTMSHPSLRTDAPSPCLPLGKKDLLKEDSRLLDERRIFGCREAYGTGGGLAEGKLMDGDY
jgi:hypothetical protein